MKLPAFLSETSVKLFPTIAGTVIDTNHLFIFWESYIRPASSVCRAWDS